MYTLANPAGIVEFHERLDASLSAMNRIHPILFFLKPSSDLYGDEKCNVTEEYSDWHRQSVNKIEAEIVPVLTQYFLNEQISKDDKANAEWVAEGLFEYVPEDIGPDYAQKLLALVQAAMGHHSYIDDRLEVVLVRLQGRLQGTGYRA